MPAGHGELLASPPYPEWAALARANHGAAAAWEFEVAGVSAGRVRALARAEALTRAAEFSARLGIDVKEPGDPEGLIVATGHQPEIYHPGVWIKDFLLQRLADETKASAFDVVVDSDVFETLSVSSPCLTPDVHLCTQYLAIGPRDMCFECAPVPSEDAIETWIEAVASQLE